MSLNRLLLALLTAGALAAPVPAQDPPPARSGVIVVIGGVGGWDPLPRSAELVFPWAGVPHRVYDFVWTHGWGQLFRDLQDTPHVIQKSAKLASQILQFKECEPDRPIYVVAKSGGAGLALLAAEQLPPNTLERIVLISPAVSPCYDLRGALRATRCEIVSYYSCLDRVILHWGTTRFGTIDGVHCPGAGMRGFQPPSDLDDEERAMYGRLVQIHWKPAMLLLGYFGMHSCNSLPLFLYGEIVQWVR
jgi:hypothetical protein